MADRIVIMKDGYIQQIGTPAEIYNTPANTFVGGFIGNPSMNFLTGSIRGGRFEISQDGETVFGFDVSGIEALRGFEGKEVIFGVRPEDVSFLPDQRKKADFSMPCDLSELLGYERIIYGYIGGQRFIAKTNADDLIENNKIYNFTVNKNKAHFFDKQTTNAIF